MSSNPILDVYREIHGLHSGSRLSVTGALYTLSVSKTSGGLKYLRQNLLRRVAFPLVNQPQGFTSELRFSDSPIKSASCMHFTHLPLHDLHELMELW